MSKLTSCIQCVFIVPGTVARDYVNVAFLSPSPSAVIISLSLGLLSWSDLAVGCVPNGCPLFRSGGDLAPVELICPIAQNLLASLISALPAELCAGT